MSAAAGAKKPSILDDVIGGYWTGKGIVAALELGVCDALPLAGVEGVTAKVVADKLKLHDTHLYRLLRGLTVSGFVSETADHKFNLTEEGAPLQTSHPHSMRGLVLLELAGIHPKLYNQFNNFLTTGGNDAFPLEFESKDAYDYMKKDVPYGDLFHEGMSCYSRAEAQHVAAEVDFSNYKTVIDLGGGKGELIHQVQLNLGDKVKDIKFSVVDLAESFHGETSNDKITYVEGDMVKGPIPSADYFMVKHIFEGFDDETTLKVMNNLSACMGPKAKMGIIEYTILAPGVPGFGKLLDCHMIVFGGGKGRNLAQMTELLAKAGFEVIRCVPSAMGIVLTECQKMAAE